MWRCSSRSAASAISAEVGAFEQKLSSERLRTSGSVAVMMDQSSLTRRSFGLFARSEDLNDFSEDLIAIAAVHGKSELRGEEAVFHANIEALAFVNHGEVLLALREESERGGEAGTFLSGVGKEVGEDLEDGGGEHVHAVKAEVLAASESGNDEALFGFSGSGFLENRIDAIEAGFTCNGLAADGAEVWKEILARDLNGGDGAAGGCGGVDEALCGAAGFRADVDVIADEVEEWLVADEIARAGYGIGVATGGTLRDEGEANGIFADEFGVRLFIAGRNDDADVVDASAGGFVYDQAEDGALDALLVDEQLHGQGALTRPCRCDHCLANLHSEVSPP